MSTASDVLAALEEVHDPEVDRSVTDMGFIRSVTEDGGAVRIVMQLPTYFCAPNFTWLMVDDVRQAAERVVGKGAVSVSVEDHFESERIQSGVQSRGGFMTAFPSEAEGDLEDLRDHFRRKTLLIRQEQVCRQLEEVGVDAESLVDLVLGDVIRLDPPALGKYLTTREELGVGSRHDDPFLIAADGRPVGPEQVRAHRRSARVMAVSFEGNGHLCKALLAERYPAQLTTVDEGEVA